MSVIYLERVARAAKGPMPEEDCYTAGPQHPDASLTITDSWGETRI